MDVPSGNNDAPTNSRNNHRRLSHSTISSANSEYDRKPAAKPTSEENQTDNMADNPPSGDDIVTPATTSTPFMEDYIAPINDGSSRSHGRMVRPSSSGSVGSNASSCSSRSRNSRDAKVRSTGGTRLVSPLSPRVSLRQPATSTSSSGQSSSSSSPAPRRQISMVTGGRLELAPPVEIATDGAILSPNDVTNGQSSESDNNNPSSRSASPAGVRPAMGKTRITRRGVGQRRPPPLPPGSGSASSANNNDNNSNTNENSTTNNSGSIGGGAVLLEMTGSTRSLMTTPGDRINGNAVGIASPATRRAAAERKAQEIRALQRQAQESNGNNRRRYGVGGPHIRQIGGGIHRQDDMNNNNDHGTPQLPGAYSVPGPGPFAENPRLHTARRAASLDVNGRVGGGVATMPRGSTPHRAASVANPMSSLTGGSSGRMLVNAVLVRDDDALELSQRERQLQEQERRIAEQQVKLQAWEEELERKERELELLTAPGAVVQAEVIKPAPAASIPPSLSHGGLRKVFFGSGGANAASSAGGEKSVSSSQKREADQAEDDDDDGTSVAFHLPLTPMYSKEDSAREDAIDYVRAELELGEGPMRFSSRYERSFDAQVTEMTKSNKRVLKHLLQRWEDHRAKKRAHALSKEWILKFACVSANKQGQLKETVTWKAMRKLKKRYVRLSAHGLEQQLLSKTLFPIPGLKTIDGQEMFYMKPARYFPRETRTRDIIDNLNYVINTMLEREHPCTHGIGFCANMNDWEWKNFEVNYCLQFMLTLQSFNVPVRVELFLIVNPPSWFGAIWKIMKPMLAPSFRKKVKVILRDKLPRYLAPGFEEFLPDEMEGGQANTDELVNDFVTYRKYYEWKMGDVHYYEPPAPPTTSNFGAAGASSSIRSGSDSRDGESQSLESDSAAHQMQAIFDNSFGDAASTSPSQISALSFDEESEFMGSTRSGSLKSGDEENEDDDASIDDDLSLFSDVGWD